MAKREFPRPTDAELAILRVLWQEGPATVREVRDILERSQPTGYTTVLKLLQIMTEKGLVLRDLSERSHRYRASRSQDKTQRQLVGDLLEPRLRRVGQAACHASDRLEASFIRRPGRDSEADRGPRAAEKRG